MLFHNVLQLIEEKGESLLLLDVDATLVIPDNIFIHKKNPDGTITKLSPAQYAREKVNKENQQNYSFDEFRDPQKVYNSIKTGIPLIPNLKIVDEYIHRGWKIGILTARGMEEVVFKALKDWLMYKDTRGNLRDIGDKLVRGLVHAINDDRIKYEGATDYERKVNVIRKLATQYDRIVLLDDDLKNINAVKKLGLQNVFAKQAHKVE
jgi:2-hydroxy-3-keto-5-methylthiopentenyl-1-phosphate phosphatase